MTSMPPSIRSTPGSKPVLGSVRGMTTPDTCGVWLLPETAGVVLVVCVSDEPLTEASLVVVLDEELEAGVLCVVVDELLLEPPEELVVVVDELLLEDVVVVDELLDDVVV